MSRTILSLCVSLTIVGPVWSQEPVVWVASRWQHVLRSTEPGDARSAKISAARNEYEPLRVIIHASSQELTDVRVTAADLTGPAGRIAATNIALFREHYIDIFQPSPRSKAPTGWYPDALIPFGSGNSDDDSIDNGAVAKYPSQPMNVEPGTNQGVWVDVYIPRDAAPGEYSGIISVMANGALLGSIPLTVRVEPFALPDKIAITNE